MPQTDPAAPRRGAVAALVTVACHVLFLLLLWVLKLSSDRPTPKPTEVLIAVNVGNVASAAGAIEPGGTPYSSHATCATAQGAAPHSYA